MRHLARDTFFRGKVIHETAGNPDLSKADVYRLNGEKLFEESKINTEVAFRILISQKNDKYIETLLEELLAVKPYSQQQFIKLAAPNAKFFCRDALAMSQGILTPPHMLVAAECFTYQVPSEVIDRLLPVLKKAYSYISRSQKTIAKEALVGTNVFIGHGRSHVWRDLKDFVTERLKLPFDEFNRVPVAGITNIARLAEMLDSAAVAFIVMTAEDEQADGTMEARTNVIHEVGLFQGRLGFTRAIVLLEEGCQEFSNIQGLGQIRFPKGDIKAKFEEIRQVLEREKIIES
ncbi:nucleotide-binding protein [Pseudomonas syringae group genomosp. 3]|uniref:nucleotide-binding protein n=1 Tax=Pseudomonas syringae group genomosp. 3 TaxID=251701 RepID=UPI0021803D99|nr:nucleotide-binding protein [Pseudomonas syringae group genomosp. 3]